MKPRKSRFYKNNTNNLDNKSAPNQITSQGFNQTKSLNDTVFQANPSNPSSWSNEFSNKLNKTAALGEVKLVTTTDIYSVVPGYARQNLLSAPNKKIDYRSSYSREDLNKISPLIDDMYKANSKAYRWPSFTSPAAGRLSSPSLEVIAGSHDLVGRIILDTQLNVYKPSPKLKLLLEIAKKISNAFIRTPLTNNKLDQYSCSQFFGLNTTQTTKFITDTGYTSNMLAIASLISYFLIYCGTINLTFFRFQMYIRIAQTLPTINAAYWDTFQEIIRDTSNKDRNVYINTTLATFNYGYLDANYWLNELIAVNQCGKPTNDGTTEFRVADITLNRPTFQVEFAGQPVALPIIPNVNSLVGSWQTTCNNLIRIGQPIPNLHQQLEDFVTQCRSIRTFMNFLAPILDTIDVPKFQGSLYMDFIDLSYFRTMKTIEPLPANNFWSESLISISWLPEMTPAYNWNSSMRVLQLLIPGVKTAGWSDHHLKREYIKTAISFKFDSLSEKVRSEIEPYARITAIRYCLYWYNEGPSGPNDTIPQQMWIEPATVEFYYAGNWSAWISENQLRNFIMNRFMFTRLKYKTSKVSSESGFLDCTSGLTAACVAVYTQDISNFDYNAYSESYFGSGSSPASFNNKTPG